MLLTVLVAGLLVALPAGSATAEPVASRLAFTPSFRGVGVFHDDVANDVRDRITFTATLETDDAGTWRPLVGAVVRLERRPVGRDGYRTVAEALTDETGTVAFARWVGRSARYRAAYDGDADSDPVTSAPHLLRAMRDLNARVTQDGRRLRMHGPGIGPRYARQPISFHRKTCPRCSWVRIDSARTGTRGQWSFPAQFPVRVGTWRYRAQIRATPGFLRSTSVVLQARTVPARGPTRHRVSWR